MTSHIHKCVVCGEKFSCQKNHDVNSLAIIDEFGNSVEIPIEDNTGVEIPEDDICSSCQPIDDMIPIYVDDVLCPN